MVTLVHAASAGGDRCRLRTALVALAAALLLSASTARPQALADTAASPRDDLAVRLEAQRAAFLANDADRLLAGFAAGQSVFVHLPPIAPAGFLPPGPLRAFLDRLVASRRTVAIELPVAGDTVDVAAGVAHVRARWQFHPAGSATLQTELMHLTWRDLSGNGAWAIVELKSAMR